DLLYSIGIGNQLPMVIARKLVVVEAHELDKSDAKKRPLSIKGTEGMVVHFADCCQPIPGDRIIGRFQQGRGILVHTSDCVKIKKMKSNLDQLVALRWDEGV